MEQFTKVAQLSSLAPGEMLAVEVNGESVLVANVDGNIHAVSETCTHVPTRRGSCRWGTWTISTWSARYTAASST